MHPDNPKGELVLVPDRVLHSVGLILMRVVFQISLNPCLVELPPGVAVPEVQ